MGRAQATIVSVLAGVLLGASWMALVDGSDWNKLWRLGREGTPVEAHERQPPFHWYYWIPAALIAMFMAGLNIVSISGLVDDDTSGRATAKKVFVFVMISGAVCCFGGATYISAVHLGEPLPLTHGVHSLPNDEEFASWPGISLVVNAIGQLIAGVLFFGARSAPRAY